MQRGYRVVVPVKSTEIGKSRLSVPAALRARLAAAMAVDTVRTVSEVAAVTGVLVVVETAADGERFRGGKVSVLRTGARGLNAAIADGLLALPADLAAVLPADLPGLVAADLAAALELAAPHPFSVVADNAGTGTTLLAGSTPAAVRPHYGIDSFAEHVRAGATPLAVPLESSLRWDVDVVADLQRPVGPATTRVLRAAGLPSADPVRINY